MKTKQLFLSLLTVAVIGSTGLTVYALTQVQSLQQSASAMTPQKAVPTPRPACSGVCINSKLCNLNCSSCTGGCRVGYSCCH